MDRGVPPTAVDLITRSGHRLGTVQLTTVVDFSFLVILVTRPARIPVVTQAPFTSIYSALLMPERILIHSQAPACTGNPIQLLAIRQQYQNVEYLSTAQKHSTKYIRFTYGSGGDIYNGDRRGLTPH